MERLLAQWITCGGAIRAVVQRTRPLDWPPDPLLVGVQAEGLAFAYLWKQHLPELLRLYDEKTGDTEHKLHDPASYGAKHVVMELLLDEVFG